MVLENTWVSGAAVAVLTIAGVAVWWRLRESLFHMFEGDSTHERRLRKRTIEVALVLICAWVLLHGWAARHGR